jgi:hypothetical protein
MNTIQPPAVADANIPGVEFDENGQGKTSFPHSNQTSTQG